MNTHSHASGPHLNCESLEPRLMLSTVDVFAAGTTGDEQIQLEINGTIVQTWSDLGDAAYAGEFVTRSFTTAENVNADQVRISFINDLYEPGGVDRNVRIDAIQIDGTRFETESPDVYSTGTWLAADGITHGNRQSEYLHSNGYLQFADSEPGNGSVIEIRAAGEEGGEQFILQIDGQTVSSWTTSTTARTFRFVSDDTVTADQVRVAFTNDFWDPNGIDRNLVVDFVSIDGVVFETESPAVYSTGTWLPGDGLVPGNRLSETLHSNGYFQYSTGHVTGGEDVVDRLNQVLPDGWTFAMTNDGTNIRLQTFDASGNAAVSLRFGSAGVITDVKDSRTGENLLAPSFQGEVTDRVIQWTLWELGQTVRYDVPSLPDFEDRFNLTQAGTFENVLSGTVDVDLDQQTGQLDVWSIVDRQWKSELEAHINGSVTALTQTQILDGGAILVRRVLRVGDISLNGQQVTLDNPYLEAWTPVSDSAFNSMALSIDPQGVPNHWYADSQNIPHFPSFPVAQTRGWAMAYDRSDIANGPTMAIVFGRDQGQVHLADGTTTDPRRFVLNSIDFDGGFGILPGFWAGPLPAGSIIDQSYILVPDQGITAGTAATLDALSAQLPPPQVYHPGSNPGGDIGAIADRLANLTNEPRTATDNLGVV